jgi:putative ABC transport system permease protein
MAAGAIFGTLNTMYSAVAARTLEIGTLRAIGFGGVPIVTSVLIEVIVLALAGSLIGALLAWVFFNGTTVNTLGSGFTQVVFQLTVTPPLVRSAMLWACLMGMIGGLLPALRAARIPIVAALRAT